MFSAYEDTEQLIKLTADKRTLAERSWSKAVVKCFSNHGRVMQWLRRMKEHVLDTFKIDSVHLEYIKSNPCIAFRSADAIKSGRDTSPYQKELHNL